MSRLQDVGTNLIAVLYSPVQRVEDAPAWAKVMALVTAFIHLIQTDMFTGALTLCFVTSALDYFFGVKAARLAGRYKPTLAQSGVLGKMSGLFLILLIRFLEWWANHHHLLNTEGALSVALAVSLFAVDLQSIAHHRESFGAKPIPLIGQVFNFLQAWASSKVPPTPQPRKPDGPGEP